MLKRDLEFDIIHVGEVDSSNVKLELLKILEEQDSLPVNNNRSGFATHSKTKSHLLYDFPLDWDGKQSIDSVLVTDNKTLIDSVNPLISKLEEKYSGNCGRVLLVNLPAGESIPEHKDSGAYLQIVHRNHIPIITNNNVMFGVGDTVINMKENNVYEINNHKNHYVDNLGPNDRYHLIIDIIPKQLPSYEII
jgi:hypothetical protein